MLFSETPLLPEATPASPNTSSKSATFEPISVPSPNFGTPCIAEMIDIVPSGSADITATIKKLTIKYDMFSFLATMREYFIASSALLTTNSRNNISKIRFSIILLLVSPD